MRRPSVGPATGHEVTLTGAETLVEAAGELAKTVTETETETKTADRAEAGENDDVETLPRLHDVPYSELLESDNLNFEEYLKC